MIPYFYSMRFTYLHTLTLFSIFTLTMGYFTGKENEAEKLEIISPETVQFVCDRRSDSLELVKFYNATGGPNWWKKWDLNKPMNTWWGVQLNNEGCVISVILSDTLRTDGAGFSGNNLSGNLENVNIPNLETLALDHNKLSCEIPLFDKLVSLKHLLLSANNFQSSIPNFRTPRLEFLDLSLNRLSGEIPNFKDLPFLRTLYLMGNKLTGSIPNFDGCSLIQSIHLIDNNLSGIIPEFTNNKELQQLYFNNNQLSGSIPNFNLPKLTVLSFTNNQLSGTCPIFDRISNLSILELSRNQLIGNLPNYNNFPNLQTFRIHNNQLTGTIPKFSNFPQLLVLDLSENRFSNNIPLFVNSSKLQRLYFQNNNLSSQIPDFIASYPELGNLTYEGNKFTFNDLLINNSKNKNLVSKNTQCSSCQGDSLTYSPQQLIYIDTTIFIPSNTTYTLDLLIDDTVTTSIYTWYKNNLLYKTIKGSNKLSFASFTAADAGTYTVKITNPHAPQLTLESHPIRLVAGPSLVCDRRSDSLELVRFYNATGGSNWTRKWDLSKSMSTWWGITLSSEGCVAKIELDKSNNINCCDGNNLIGVLPSLHLSELKAISVFNNQLTGSIPDLNEIPKLEDLVLSKNNFTGSIPAFTNLPFLKNLVIQDNPGVNGSIPDFKNFPNLESIKLERNGLTGVIPDFSNIPKLKSIYLLLNNLTGPIPNFRNLKELEIMDIGSNSLTGTIPNFNNLLKLERFIAGGNMLSGELPDFSSMPNLKLIGLNNNKLSGYLHDYSSTHKFLSSLDIFDNQYTFYGLIQNTKVVSSLTKSSLIGFPTDSFTYAPQSKVFVDTTIYINQNSNYTLDLKFDDTVNTSSYTWYKNNVFYKTIKGSNKLPFTPFTAADAGTYTVKITNPHAPQLILESHPIRLIAGPSMVCDRKSDSLELVRFYNATGGSNWITKWDLSKPMDTWWGITLNSNGCVEIIEQVKSGTACCDGNNLVGALPEITLQYLKTISIVNNEKLVGNLPGFRQCPNLENLIFRTTGLTGTIPNFNLPKLTLIDFFQNKFIGAIPDFDSIPNLDKLDVSFNELTGSIPNFKNIKKVKYINVGTNDLSGPIPDLSNTPLLEDFIAINGRISGPIPNFTKISNLKNFLFGNQKIIGTIPNFTNLPNLEFLGLATNLLTGDFPSLVNCPKLIGGTYSYNYFTGVIPPYFKTHPNLTWGNFEVNNLTFEDIIPYLKENKSLIDKPRCPTCTDDSLVYAQQRKVFVDTTITIKQNTNYTLDLKFDDTVTSSTYVWYKNGVVFRTIKGSNKLPFTSFTSADAGTYTVRITNPLAPQLILESHPIRLVAQGCIINYSIDQATSKITESCSGKNDAFINIRLTNFNTITDSIYIRLNNLRHILPTSITLNIARFDSLPVGLHTLILKNSSGCNITDGSINIISPSEIKAQGLTIYENPCPDLAQGVIRIDSVTGGIRPYTYTLSNGTSQNFGQFIRLASGKYTIQIKDANGCTVSLNAELKEPKRIIANLDNSAFKANENCGTVNCNGQARILFSGGTDPLNNFQVRWPSGEVSQNGASATAVKLCSGNQELTVFDGNGCSVKLGYTIDFENPLSKAILKEDKVIVKHNTSTNFDVLSNENIPPNITVLITIDNPASGKMIYSQATGKGNYTPNKGFSGKEKLSYKVCLTDCPDACQSSTIEFDVQSSCFDKNNFFYPNAILPNSNVQADRFFIVEEVVTCQSSFGKPTLFKVYNRWGALVYTSDNYKNDWSGTNQQGQPLPDGTYYYLIDVGSTGSVVKGTITIIR